MQMIDFIRVIMKDIALMLLHHQAVSSSLPYLPGASQRSLLM
jgi:hypothetical protein